MKILNFVSSPNYRNWVFIPLPGYTNNFHYGMLNLIGFSTIKSSPETHIMQANVVSKQRNIYQIPNTILIKVRGT